jgi:hypothetical protein
MYNNYREASYLLKDCIEELLTKLHIAASTRALNTTASFLLPNTHTAVLAVSTRALNTAASSLLPNTHTAVLAISTRTLNTTASSLLPNPSAS